jgi:glycosyltransferase involved in cell wall biosynthesis
MCTMLKQSLFALIRACRDIDYELIVIDDASTDRSVEMVKDEFSEVNLILNKFTFGVAKARNQGIELATGRVCFTGQCGYN